MRILHVALTPGSGVETTIGSYCLSLPDASCRVLVKPDLPFPTRVPALDGADVHLLPVGNRPLAIAAAFRQHVRDFRPDVVHAHSSGAGFAVRLMRGLGVPIVYTPHAFAFERAHDPTLFRAAYRLVERALVGRTDVFAGASAHEAELGSRLGHRPVFEVPHSVDGMVDGSVVTRSPFDGGRIRVVTSGRIAEQKDPAWFLRAVDAVRRDVDEAEFTWIGGGDATWARRLEANGVCVTGWLPRADAMQVVADADLYLHTAAWEVGLPYSVIEAMVLSRPVLLRPLEAYGGLGLDDLLVDEQQLASRVADLAEGRLDWRALDRRRWAEERFSRVRQRDALQAAYEAASR